MPKQHTFAFTVRRTHASPRNTRRRDELTTVSPRRARPRPLEQRSLLRAYRTPEEFARAWTPSLSLIVIEQSGASVKDSLRRAETRVLDRRTALLKASEMRAKGKTCKGARAYDQP